MAFKIRRGTDAERLTITPAEGELIYTTDTKKIYVGDGTTVGGKPVDSELPISELGDDLIISPDRYTIIGDRDNNKDAKILLWSQTYNNSLFQGPINYLQSHNNTDSNNISFYRTRGTSLAPTVVQNGDKIIDINLQAWDGNSVEMVANIEASVFGTVSDNIVPGLLRFRVHDKITSGIAGLVTVAEMDSDLYLRTNKIASVTANTDLSIESNGTGRIKINNLNWPTSDGSSGNYLTTNGSGELQWSAPLNLTGYATTTYVDSAISNIIDGAPNLLNTLNELAAAIADDANFATTTTTALGNRVRFDDVQTLTPTQKLVAQSNIGLTPSALQSDWTQSDNTASDFIKNKPTIPAAQVASDWNATTGVSAIANKPTIPSFSAVGQDILPTTDVTYDLGSPSKRFRDLYLSGSTIDLGGKTLSINNNTLSIGGNKFGESGNVVGVAITQLYNNTVYIRLDVGSAAETIANNIIAGDILKLDPAVGLITQLTVVSNDGGVVDINNTAFKDYEITVAETGPSDAANIFFDLVKPIATDVKQLQDSEGLLDRTSISSGPTAPGSAAVANNNDVSINFSDAVGTKFKFNRDGKIDFPAAQYGSSVSTMFAEYGFRFRPTWNGVGTGPELAISWNDGIELTPVTNDHFTVGNKATPFFLQGTYTDQAGKLPGDVWVDGGRNGPTNTNGIVNIGRGNTSAVNIGKSGTATTITFNDGTSLSSTTGLGGANTGDFTFTANTIETDNGAAAVVVSINGPDGAPTPALIQRKWSFATDGSINFLDPLINTADASITTTKVGNWDTAYGWGDHSTEGYLTAVPDDGFEAKSTATGVVTHDCATNKVFVHSSISANFTANLTNLNLAAGTATNITLVLNQDATAYICNALQIGGVAQTINWQGSSSAPTGNSSKKDVMSFSILNVAGTYTILGQLVSFG